MPDTITADVDRPQSLTVADLVDRFMALNEKHTELYFQLDELRLAARREFPPRPDDLIITTLGTLGRRDEHRDLEERDIHRHFDAAERTFGSTNSLREKRAALLAKLKEFLARCDEVLRRHGYFELEERYNATDEVRDGLIDLIRTTPAQTVADVLAKLRLADHFEEFVLEECENPESPVLAPKLIASAIADLERLAARDGLVGFV